MHTKSWVASALALGLALALGAFGCSNDDSGSLPPAAGAPQGPASPGDGSGAGSITPGGEVDAGTGGGPTTRPGDADGGTAQIPDASNASNDAAPPVDASPPADANPPPPVDSGDPLAAARALCVQTINQDRATLSPASPPLTEATDQESCVDQQAQKDYVANTAHSAFGACNEFAQNECPGWGGPPLKLVTDCLTAMWNEGPPPAGQDNHWLNMSNAQYTKVACGFYQTPAGDWWATQDFW